MSDNSIPILMYHSISNDTEPGIPQYYRLNTSPIRFREQMLWLVENGYRVIDLSNALRFLSMERPVIERCVVLTFDDGYRDFMTNAWPILVEFDLTATVFLPTDFIGTNRMFFKGRECMTWKEVRELHSSGVLFGSHTASHSILSKLLWKEVRRELVDSRIRLEDELQASVLSFSYPYAFPQENRKFVVRFRQELIDQGYHNAVTTLIGRAKRECNPMSLRRLPMNEGDDEKLFKAKLWGAYDFMANVQTLVRHAKLYLRSGR